MVKGEMGVWEALWLGPCKEIMLQRSNAKSINVKKKKVVIFVFLGRCIELGELRN